MSSTNTTSPFIAFCNAKRAEVKAANPNANFGDIARLLSVAWKELNETKKSAYKAPHKNNESESEPGLRRSSRLRNKRLGLNFWGTKI
jgi:hypothetical protein